VTRPPVLFSRMWYGIRSLPPNDCSQSFDSKAGGYVSELRSWNCRNCGRSNRTIVEMNGTVRCEYCTALMPSLPISQFRRLLAEVRGWFGERPDGNPARSSPIHLAPGLGRDSEIETALAHLRDCHSLARGLVSPAERNANLEWVLGLKRDPKMKTSAFDEKTVDAIALSLEELAASLSRASAEPSKGSFEDAPPDHHARRSVAQGLRDATEGFVLASGRPARALGSSARP
jgi:hypothetical protein